MEKRATKLDPLKRLIDARVILVIATGCLLAQTIPLSYQQESKDATKTTNVLPPPMPPVQSSAREAVPQALQDRTGVPRSTPAMGPDGPLPPAAIQNHWWDITFFTQNTNIYHGEFVARANTFSGLNQEDHILVLPLNVAIGSPSNLVWFQFDLDFYKRCNGATCIQDVDWLIWPNPGPTGCDSNLSYVYHDISISSPYTNGLAYTPGDSYHFDLYEDGARPNYMVFSVVNDSKGGIGSGAFWWHEWPVTSTNLVYDYSCFSPSTAVEGYTDFDTTSLSKVPLLKFTEKYGITNPQMGGGFGESIGIGQSMESTGVAGVWDWKMHRAGNSDTIPPSIVAPASATVQATGSMTSLCQNIPVGGQSVTASGHDGNTPGNVIDNSLSSRWSNFGVGSWITEDLGSKKVICSVDVAWYQGNTRSNNFVVSVSDDGILFKPVFTGMSSSTTNQQVRYEFLDTIGRYLRITVNGNSMNNWASIAELDANGYTSLGFPTVSDNTDTSPIVFNNAPALGFFLGTTTVTWTAEDASGNTNSDSQLVTVIGASDTTRPTVSVTSPTTGSTITGPTNNVRVTFTGTATDSGSGVQKVELKSLKGGVAVHQYQQATAGAPQPATWANWFHTLTFTQAGTYTITARVTDMAGNQNWHSVTINVAFASASDTVIPTVSITSSQSGASFSGPSSVPKKISFAGVAADSGSGVQKVELKSLKSGTVVHAYQLAGTSNNWSSWSKTLSFSQSGTYTITARVTDNAGNQNWHSITVNISLN